MDIQESTVYDKFGGSVVFSRTEDKVWLSIGIGINRLASRQLVLNRGGPVGDRFIFGGLLRAV